MLPKSQNLSVCFLFTFPSLCLYFFGWWWTNRWWWRWPDFEWWWVGWVVRALPVRVHTPRGNQVAQPLHNSQDEDEEQATTTRLLITDLLWPFPFKVNNRKYWIPRRYRCYHAIAIIIHHCYNHHQMKITDYWTWIISKAVRTGSWQFGNSLIVCCSQLSNMVCCSFGYL